MLTQEQKTAYIDSGGVKCPYCASPDLLSAYPIVHEAGADHPILCLSCKERWVDRYQLASIEEI